MNARIALDPVPGCTNGWRVIGKPGCTYTGGHYCERDRGHRGRCRCTCGATAAAPASQKDQA